MLIDLLDSSKANVLCPMGIRIFGVYNIRTSDPWLLVSKLDLANAYRCIKIHPSNFKATGLKWRFANDNFDTFLIDERLSFGASNSPEIFNILTQAVRAIMAKKGYKTIVCYLDDFLIVAQTYDECIHTLNVLIHS